MSRFDISALRFDGLIGREWLATHGNGSFASSTICGTNTRKYHGLLVAAMAPPVRRMVVLSRVEETIIHQGQGLELAANEYPGVVHPRGHTLLRAFSPEPFPRWAYQSEGWTIEKQLRPIRGENTVVLSYTLVGGGGPVDLELRPLFALRGIHELMYQWNGRIEAVAVDAHQQRIPASSRTPEAFFAYDGEFSPQPCWYLNTIYRREQERGYAGLEDLWMPGVVRLRLLPGHPAHFICSTEPIDMRRVLAQAERQFDAAPLTATPNAVLETLLRAADQFLVESRDGGITVMAAYPWATPSGRDAMICVPGLLLARGRIDQATRLLRSFAALERNGLMPTDLAEDGGGWRYTGADVSLWFIHAVDQYLRYGGDEDMVLGELLPVMLRIIERYQHGTDLGIGTDPDGLVHTHAPGTPTTWMDAKVGDWVITPRQGRPVSLNALWYNALCVVAGLCRRVGQPERGEDLAALAARVREAFNGRFWNERESCCFDVVEDHGNDPSVRPNQLLAISLPHAVLDEQRHGAVLARVRRELLTPVGLRTLSPHDHSYQGTYAGPVVARDRAYHQGSVYPWLLGPFITALMRHQGRTQQARSEALSMLEGCFQYLLGPGLGQVCELFDGDAPHRPGGAIASARSVAELLRCYVQDVLEIAPGQGRPSLAACQPTRLDHVSNRP